MIDETELFYKIESKQFELDYNNSFDKDIREYSKTKGQVEALEWVKRLIAKESEDLEIDNSIMLGKEWD
ncbi:hypothetical protein KSU03_12185 [Fusobacterium polymorphum]|uniref:Uncharacterized protein n=1 Tax=Fusobacterium nucleatum subsp. polymorphum TaxID=76857 RepID=A0A2C5ZYB8_FUSNP|nr:hypothetical protein [Fusobacterium polymorphum]PHI04360.1 hypothetical protein CBG52_11415 [Fusobacterium polymorphum]